MTGSRRISAKRLVKLSIYKACGKRTFAIFVRNARYFSIGNVTKCLMYNLVAGAAFHQGRRMMPARAKSGLEDVLSLSSILSPAKSQKVDGVTVRDSIEA